MASLNSKDIFSSLEEHLYNRQIRNPALSNLTGGIIADHQIAALCQNTDKPMITPFCDKLTEVGKISYGLSSYGYDARLGRKTKLVKRNKSTVLDPKNLDTAVFEDHEGDYVIIPPH